LRFYLLHNVPGLRTLDREHLSQIADEVGCVARIPLIELLAPISDSLDEHLLGH
jgi:hypothetical protein